MSKQLDERLRRAARTCRELGKYTTENMFLEASDTICKLRGENARLRELVRGLYWCNGKEWNKGACDDCPIRGRAVGRCERIMRELGVEADA